VLAQSLRLSQLRIVWFPLSPASLPSIHHPCLSRSPQRFPSSPSTVPCCIIPITFLYSPSCLRSFPSNSPIIPHPVLRAKSHGLTRPARYDCVVPCDRSTQRRTRACLDRPCRGRRSQHVVWGCYFTVIGRNVSLLIGVGPSLPLLMFRSCVLFPFIPRPPKTRSPFILTYLIVRFLCTFFPLV